jgi:hypothetical protein
MNAQPNPVVQDTAKSRHDRVRRALMRAGFVARCYRMPTKHGARIVSRFIVPMAGSGSW